MHHQSCQMILSGDMSCLIKEISEFFKRAPYNFFHLVLSSKKVSIVRCWYNDEQSPTLATLWHEIFARVYFCELRFFCVLGELIFAIGTDWFFLLGTNFCDFEKIPIVKNWWYFRFCLVCAKTFILRYAYPM